MLKLLIIPLAALWILTGCGSSSSTVSTIDKPAGYTVYNSVTGDIPYPNDVLFAGSKDGTLNIPFDPNAPDAPVKSALNALDGFSTVAPTSVSLTEEMNASTLPGNVHLFEVNTVTSKTGIPAVIGTIAKLQFGKDYFATMSGKKLVILPLTPLKGGSHYMVILTNGIKNSMGQALHADTTTHMLNSKNPLIGDDGNPTVYFHPDPTVNAGTAAKIEGLRQLTQMMFAQAVAGGIKRANIVMAWSFSTQSIGKVANAFADANISGTLAVKPTGMTSKKMLELAGHDTSAMAGIADIYAGKLMNLPYYLGVPSKNNPTAPITASFEMNSSSWLPIVQENRSIPVLASVPNTGTQPANGWPVVIFQHGITQNRTNLLPISEAFASIGYAAVAIDLPLHGIDNNASPLYMKNTERTFDVDFIDNATMLPGPDGKIDPSGFHYINLASLLTSRDNLRQSTSDLIALKNALSTAIGIKFDSSRVAFVGHSLGTIASFGFLNHADLESVTLAMPGSGIAQLLNNSATFGPIIAAGLASKGVIKGTSAYDAFMLATQTVIDDGDPINYAITAGNRQKTFIIGVKGDGAGTPSDLVIPNFVRTAPLSGTRPLAMHMHTSELNITNAPGIIPLNGNVVTCFTQGDHSSILDPKTSLAATVEMQKQTASFIFSKGSAIQATDTTVLQ